MTATIVGETKGPKVNVAKYRNKTGYRRTRATVRSTRAFRSGHQADAGSSASKPKSTDEETTDGT